MMLKVVREPAVGNYLFGLLFINGVYRYRTLENNEKKIIPGNFSVSFYSSPKFHMLVPLLAVPDREYIEIHPANYPSQLEGCIAVGMSKTDEILQDSRNAFFALMKTLRESKDITIKVEDSDYQTS